MLILMNLMEDLNFLVTNQLSNRGYQPRAQDNPYDRFCMYHEHCTRHIAPIPRQVEISHELELHERYNSHKPVITEIINRFEGGKDLTPYLSKGVVKFNSYDQLLLYWGIHHLHLSPLATIENGFVKRSDDLLFVRIEKEAAFLIDILPHDDPNLFVQKRALEIVDNNWPNLHREVFGAIGESLNLDQIKGLRKNNANIIEHVNNRSIMPTMGVTAAGNSIDATYTFDRYQIELSHLESEVRHHFFKFFPSKIPPWMTHVRLYDVWEKGFDICELVTGQKCHVQLNH